jgi:hypothetical protein
MSTCSSCGRRHVLMELCPVKPGLRECLLQFIDGERDAVAWLAFVGLAAVLFVTVLAIQVAAS